MSTTTPRKILFPIIAAVAILSTGQALTGDPIGPRIAAYQSESDYFRSQWGFTLDNVYWGDLHNHTLASLDATLNDDVATPEQALVYARDKQQLDFVSLTDHAEEPNPAIYPLNTDKSLWDFIMATNKKYNDEKRFIVFPGWEYTNTYGLRSVNLGSGSGYGHKNIVIKDLNNAPSERIGAWPLQRLDDHGRMDYSYAKTNRHLWSALRGYQNKALTIIHTPCMSGIGNSVDPSDHRTDWNVLDRGFSRHVEVYSKWGSCEGHPHPEAAGSSKRNDTPKNADSDIIDESYTVRKQLYEGWVKRGDHAFTLGFVGGTDTHTGNPGYGGKEAATQQFPGTVTGIVATKLGRDALWQGLWRKRTIANEALVNVEGVTNVRNQRTPALFALESGGSHFFMGDTGAHNGTVTAHVIAGGAADRIEILVDGVVKKTVSAKEARVALSLDRGSHGGRHFVYARIWKQNRLLTFTSPIYLYSG